MAKHDTIRADRPTRTDTNVKAMLLNASEPERWKTPLDTRPLIDQLHEATFTNPVGLQWIKDKYGLRMLLRKAHCFTLDAETSALVADFSIAIGSDLESARRMAIPPFPVTWIDVDNRARLGRVKERGVGLTPTAAGETDAGPPVERVGWLIHPGDKGGYYVHYVASVEQGVMTAPLTYWWHAGEVSPLRHQPGEEGARKYYAQHEAYLSGIVFGVRGVNVDFRDATVAETPLHIDVPRDDYINSMMEEIAGELRHVWGLLIALGAGQLGMEAKYTAQPKPTGTPPTMKNGKPLLPLEHKVLHLHLAKRMTPAKVVVRMMTHHKLRWHEVRSHFRTLRNPDGTVRKRIPIASHERGDLRLGRVEKTYKVEK